MLNCLQMCLNTVKVVMISANYHDITRLLLVTIIVGSKNARYRLLAKKISWLIGKTGNCPSLVCIH